MDLGLTDKTFVVTAASAGLGRATAKVLVAEGARVVLVARRADVLDEVVGELGGADHAVALAGDLATPELAGQACRLAEQTWGRLDGAMISVGGPPRGAVLDITDDQWRRSFDSVFLPALRMVRALVTFGTADDLVAALVLSISSRTPLPTMAISNGLRPGLACLVSELADELGPDGTRVVGLMPGNVETERLAELAEGESDSELFRKRAEAAIPLRRWGRPEEFGTTAAFVLSPAASYLTGSMIAVDGGMMRVP